MKNYVTVNKNIFKSLYTTDNLTRDKLLKLDLIMNISLKYLLNSIKIKNENFLKVKASQRRKQ